ncbi:transcriptional regulator PpsR [Falsiroseomonas oryziterrae]|uniref:transcriptional regulator PpsR n=1 Tax=Falsiroseomonas oryziterrae TaxID=2911368 RepID=UPI001F017D18|nr:transcriptional regulator PpsR [Roseomonas sp. NPKOSM-4]
MTRVAITQPDVTLVLDWDGIIRDASVSSSIAKEGLEGWVGRHWTETVGDTASEQVRRLVEDARDRGISAFLQVTQRFPSGLELPIEYTTVRLGSRDGIIAVGKSLLAVQELQSRLVAAQQAREQDYWKLREIEMRSRLLFDASSEAVLVISAADLRIIEANPVAIRELGFAPGWDFGQEVALRDRAAFQELLARAREHGRTPGVLLHLGATDRPWLLRVSLMARETGPVFLIQLAPGANEPGRGLPRAVPPRTDELLEALPDAFVVADADGRVRRANRAFLELVQCATEGAVLGEPLGRWLATPGQDASVLIRTLREHGEVRLFTTTITGILGSEAMVEISASASSKGGPLAMGFLVRDVTRRAAPRPAVDDALHGALAEVLSEMGRLPLPVLVRNTAAVVERACIEQALQEANGNRTAAADALGLSRQSLYAKLERYGLHESREAEEELAG